MYVINHQCLDIHYIQQEEDYEETGALEEAMRDEADAAQEKMEMAEIVGEVDAKLKN